jgi:hypothetical protein
MMAAAGGSIEHGGTDPAILTHERADALARDAMTRGAQVGVDPRTPVATMTRFVRGADMEQLNGVAYRLLRRGTAEARVVARRRDVELPTHERDRKLAGVGGDCSRSLDERQRSDRRRGAADR